MRGPKSKSIPPGQLFWDLLTFDRRLAVPVIHLVYWAGLGLIALFAFSVVGASVGVALREGVEGLLLAVPLLVAGFLIVGALTLIWRSFCEFYVSVVRISDDIAALRAASERDPEVRPLSPSEPAARERARL
jgi:Domain of unknown function (DUF4282)